MANGKELRVITNIFTMYDVTGLINKDKRLYYVPHKEELQVGIPVCESFLNALNVVCPPPSSDFTNVEISRWLPTDRELLVKGNVDIFTKGASSHPLNYMIIKRTITNEDESTEVFYNAYFINSASQDGINSVRLSVEPDEFTNVFYLHNTRTLDADYEPFNDLIRNAYVERQHYNRIKKDGIEFQTNSLPNPTLTAGVLYVINKSLTTALRFPDTITASFKLYKIYTDGTEKEFLGEANRINTQLFFPDGEKLFIYNNNEELVNISETDYANLDYYYGIVMYEDYEISYGLDANILEVDVEYERDLANLDLFSKIEDSYNYRLQYKSKRTPLTIWKRRGISSDMTYIEKIPDLSSITTDTQVRNYIRTHSSEALTIAQSCIKYIHILTKDRITYPTVAQLTMTDDNNSTKYGLAYYSSDYESGKAIPSAQQHLVIPYISKVKGLEAFYNYFVSKGLHIMARFSEVGGQAHRIDIDTIGDDDITNIIARLQDVFGYYIQSIYITPYCELSSELSIDDYETNDYQLCFTANLFCTDVPLKSKARPKYTLFKPSSAIPYDVDEYDAKVVEKPTMVFIGKNKPEMEFAVGSAPSSISANDVAKGFYYGINYYLQKYYRKSISESEIFKVAPVPCFQGTATTGTGGEIVCDSLYETTNYENKVLCPAFLVGKKGFDDVEFEISESIPLTYFTRDKGYEPVLEFEPYTYKTLSFLDVESDIQKKRLVYTFDYGYYTGNHVGADFYIKLKYNQVVNAQFKFGLIPSYNVNGEWFRYYPDTLLFTSANGMTIRNNSFYEYTYQQGALMNAERFLTTLKGATEITKAIVDTPFEVGSGASGGASGGVMGAVAGGSSAVTRSTEGIINEVIDSRYNIFAKQVEQKAQLAGAGAKADTYTSAGTDLMYDLNNEEYFIYLNEYTIDDLSYKSVAKMLERYGYLVNIYDKLNVDDRCGWNYIKLKSFDFVEDSLKLSVAQEDVLRDIFQRGVTLMHDTSYINESKHNIEVDLKGV